MGKDYYKKLTECLSVGSPDYTREYAQFHFKIYQSGKLLLGCERKKGEARSVTLEKSPHIETQAWGIRLPCYRQLD